MTDVLVVAELLEGKARNSTLSAITAAKQIGGVFDILVIGQGAAGAAGELAGFGARKLLTAEIAGGYVGEKYAPTVAAVAKAYGVVVATASAYGKDLLPRVAAKVGAGVASDVTGISNEGGKLVYRRPMYAGNVMPSAAKPLLTQAPIHMATRIAVMFLINSIGLSSSSSSVVTVLLAGVGSGPFTLPSSRVVLLLIDLSGGMLIVRAWFTSTANTTVLAAAPAGSEAISNL